ncbi:MAG: ubiquinone/menaquinone biosynthesis methyltransferase [Gemmatimonadetes bacterium]|nr:ubiquinone/menaquinone biosynthesis methyltransferase [Gemmatimonadota bacterium]
MTQNTTRQDPAVHDRQIRAMFADIAGVYDRMNGVLSLGLDARWRQRVAAAIDPAAVDVLDACSGTGELILTAQRAGKGRRHVATDFCHPMLAEGVRTNGLGQAASVLTADTQRLPFQDASFDAVLVGFGLRNLGDLPLGLREIRRVLRPGGQLLALEFFRARRSWVARPMNLYLTRVVPFLGGLIGRDSSAYTYLPQSMGNFLTVAEFSSELERAGLSVEGSAQAQSFGVAHLVEARAE